MPSSNPPVISVVLAAYNHAAFIYDSIQSILRQTFTDLEVIVVNDGSTDNTESIVRSIPDPRLRYLKQQNSGPSVALNAGISASRGKYIAIFAADDISFPNRLERQLEHYQSRSPCLLFSHVKFINDRGDEISTPVWLQSVFNRENMSRAMVFRALLTQGNYFNAPSLFTEKSVLTETPVIFHPYLVQLQDYELWLRLAKKYDFFILQEPLVKYRIHGSNLSTPSLEKSRRIQIETFFILKSIFKDIPADLFGEAFPSFAGMPGENPVLTQIRAAQMLGEGKEPNQSLAGYSLLFDVLSDSRGADTAKEYFGLDPMRFARLLDKKDVFAREGDLYSRLYLDCGKGFSENETIDIPIVMGESENIEQTYDLTQVGELQGVRWDPINKGPCRIRLREVTFTQADGVKRTIAMETIRNNGKKFGDAIDFLHSDPSYVLPLTGKIHSLGFRATVSRLSLEQLAHDYGMDSSIANLLKGIRFVFRKARALIGA